MEDYSADKILVPSLSDLQSRKLTQGNPVWPLAHLTEVLGGIHTAKQNILMQDGHNSDSRQAFEEGRMIFKSYSDEMRGSMKIAKKFQLNSEMKGFDDQEVFRKNVDKHVKEIMKGVCTFVGTALEDNVLEDSLSGIEMDKIRRQSIGDQMGKTLPPESLSLLISEKSRRQCINQKEPLDRLWEYAFTSEPIPVVSVGKPFLGAQLNHGPERGCLIRSNKVTLEKHTSATVRVLKIDGLPKVSMKLAQTFEASEARRKEKVQNMLILKQLFCGGFAGVVSRTTVAPLDLIKTYLITSHGLWGSKRSALTICKDIVHQDGWHGLFRGNLVNCLRVAPSKAIELCIFETVRRALNQEGHPLRHAAATIAGGAAGMAGTIATYPLEVIRTRLSVQPDLYSGLLQAIKKIAQDEGLLAFYSGLSPSLVGVFPYAATNYFVYDGLRTAYCRSTGESNVPTLPTLAFGAIAAAASSAVTYPLEVARRQMQLCLTGSPIKKSTLGVILDIYQNEGFLALYRGLGTTWLKLIPAAGISFVCYETARFALQIDDASLVKPEVTIIAEQETY